MSEAESPEVLKDLVMFIIGLAIMASIVALILYFGIAVPAQQAGIHAPMNGCNGCY